MKKAKIRLAFVWLDGERERVEEEVRDGFAVTDVFAIDHREKEGWLITHIPTGALVLDRDEEVGAKLAFSTKAKAVRAIEMLHRLPVDWTLGKFGVRYGLNKRTRLGKQFSALPVGSTRAIRELADRRI